MRSNKSCMFFHPNTSNIPRGCHGRTGRGMSSSSGRTLLRSIKSIAWEWDKFRSAANCCKIRRNRICGCSSSDCSLSRIPCMWPNPSTSHSLILGSNTFRIFYQQSRHSAAQVSGKTRHCKSHRISGQCISCSLKFANRRVYRSVESDLQSQERSLWQCCKLCSMSSLCSHFEGIPWLLRCSSVYMISMKASGCSKVLMPPYRWPEWQGWSWCHKHKSNQTNECWYQPCRGCMRNDRWLCMFGTQAERSLDRCL